MSRAENSKTALSSNSTFVHACMSPASDMSNSARLCTGDCQVSWSMVFSRQEYWSGLPLPSLGDPPNPGIKPKCLMSPALSL